MSDEPIREVSPEEYHRMVSSGSVGSTARKAGASRFSGLTVPVALVIASLIVGFALGMQFEKGKAPSSAQNTANTQAAGRHGSFGGRGMRRAGGFGTVTAISSSSITIVNQRTGSDQTFKIASSTAVSNNGSSASASDIQTGDTVMVRTSATDTSTATSIMLNPSFGGGMMNPGAMGQPTPTDNTPTDSNSSST